MLEIKNLQIYNGGCKVASFKFDYISISVKYNICKVQYLQSSDHYLQISFSAEIYVHSLKEFYRCKNHRVYGYSFGAPDTLCN